MMAAEPILNGVRVDGVAVGRRASARLRLAIPARLVSLYGTQTCVLLDISRTGARLVLRDPLTKGQTGLIELARMEMFGSIVRSECGPEGGVNAMAFDDPITKAQVLEIRRFAEEFETREQEALRDLVRRWVTGEK